MRVTNLNVFTHKVIKELNELEQDLRNRCAVDLGVAAVKECRRLSSGKISKATLRRYHPFSRKASEKYIRNRKQGGAVIQMRMRNPRRLGSVKIHTFPKLPINVHEGKLRAGFKYRVVKGSKRRTIVQVFNDVTDFRRLVLDDKGNVTTVGRGFRKALRANMEPKANLILSKYKPRSN